MFSRNDISLLGACFKIEMDFIFILKLAVFQKKER